MVLVLKVGGALLALILVLAGIGAACVFTGTPKACADREIPVSDAAADALMAKWDQFKLEAASGDAAVVYNETEVTSRAVRWVGEKDIDLDNIQVYLCQEGYGEATATAPGGIDFLARGSLDLTEPRPVVDVQEVRIGNLPGIVPLEAALNFIPEEDKTLDITDVRLTTISFRDGEVTLTGRAP